MRAHVRGDEARRLEGVDAAAVLDDLALGARRDRPASASSPRPRGGLPGSWPPLTMIRGTRPARCSASAASRRSCRRREAWPAGSRGCRGRPRDPPPRRPIAAAVQAHRAQVQARPHAEHERSRVAAIASASPVEHSGIGAAAGALTDAPRLAFLASPMSVALVTAQAARSLDADLPLLVAALARRGVAARSWSGMIPMSSGPASRRLSCARPGTIRRAAAASSPGPGEPPRPPRCTTRSRCCAGPRTSATSPTSLPPGLRSCRPAGACPGRPPNFPAGGFVVKPSVGAGSVGAARFAADERPAAAQHVARLHAAGHVAVIQPYLAGVERTARPRWCSSPGPSATRSASRRSWSRPAHGRRPLRRRADRAPAIPSEAELALAQAPSRPCRGAASCSTPASIWCPTTTAHPRVLELELADCSVFLDHDVAAADRFAAARSRRCVVLDELSRRTATLAARLAGQQGCEQAVELVEASCRAPRSSRCPASSRRP
jgi:hypothetical protein